MMKIYFKFTFWKKVNFFLLIILLVALTGCNSVRESESQVEASDEISPIISEITMETMKISEGDPSSILIKTTSPTNLPINAATLFPVQDTDSIGREAGQESTMITIPATSTMTPSRTPSPTSTPQTYWSYYITFTPTPSTSYFRINNLGAYSYVLSPIVPEALVSAGEDGLVIVELIGEGGRSISKETINYSNYIGQRFGIAPEISFQLEKLSEYGRLVIYSKDRYSRIMDLTSVELILLELGNNSITPPNNFTDPIIIRQPGEYDVISGGVIQISGVARKLSDSPIIIECIDPDGIVVGDATVEVNEPNELVSHIPFEVFLPYTINERTNVRFTFRQESTSRLPGTIYLSSFEITLEP